MPIPVGVDILRVEDAIIRFESKKTIDIGARCFIERSNKHRRLPNRPDDVAFGSLVKLRIKRIEVLLESASLALASGHLKDGSMYALVRNWVRFFDWCDDNSHTSMMKDVPHARRAYRDYSECLRDEVGRGVLKNNTASGNQGAIRSMYRDYLMFAGVDDGVRRLPSRRATVSSTTVPSEDDQSRILALSTTLFDSIAPAIIEGHAYPLRISVPDYLQIEQNCFWAFPTARWFLAPSEYKEREASKCPSWPYDFNLGRVAKPKQIAEHYTTKLKLGRAIRNANYRIKCANEDLYISHRIRLSIIAMRAFLVLFSASTGMNLAQIAALRWNDDCRIGRRVREFREVKARAGCRAVSFYIGHQLLAHFKLYLRLRKFVLRKTGDTDLLFFSLIASETKSLGEDPFVPLFAFYSRLDPTITAIKSRQWRTAKFDWLIRNFDVSTAALVLQSSEQTVTAAYTAGSESQAAEELGEFFSRMSQFVKKERDEDGTATSQILVGSCSSFGHPMKEDGAPRDPDCRQPEGCLFCENYRVHADEKDIRKLTSCRSCIGKTSHLSESSEHFDAVFGDVLSRIDGLLREISTISKRHSALVDTIVREVEDDGMLDPYWQRKIESLVYLDVVAV